MSSERNDRIRVLTLDGGGIRGLASLMILRDIMQEIKLETQAPTIPKPCECFDLIGGTSTGGLIAIMLGRLGMTVEECITAYTTLSTEVFKVDKVLKEIVPLRDDQCRFDYNVFESVVKDMIRRQLGSESVGMSATTGKPSCRTFVVANLAEDPDGPPIFFRSYDVRGHGLANTCPIWQAARATSAAPTFFKPMLVDDPPPAVPYVDGGLRYNNPSQLAVEEVRRIWPGRTPTCLISIGTGRPKSFPVYDPKVLDTNIVNQRSVLEYVKGFLPEILNYLPKGNAVKNFPKGVVAVLKMANAIAKLVTSSQPPHLSLQDDNNRPSTFKYFRFDVVREVGDIGMSDTTQSTRLAGLVTGYLRDPDVINKKLECMKCFELQTISLNAIQVDEGGAPGTEEDLESEIEKWTERIKKSPSDPRWQMRLAKAYAKCSLTRGVDGWKELVNMFPEEWKLQTRLANALAALSESNKTTDPDDPFETEIETWRELVTDNPTVWGLHVQLRKSFQKTADLEEEIRIWKTLVDRYPKDWKLQSELAEAYEKRELSDAQSLGDLEKQIGGWRELVDKHPEEWELQVRLANVYRKKSRLEGAVLQMRTQASKTPLVRVVRKWRWQHKAYAEIRAWEDLVWVHPESRGIQMQLEIAYSRQDDRERAIKGWKKLVEKYPGNRELEIHLRRAYEWKEKEHTPEEMKCIEAEIEGWKELVMKHSDVSSLQTYLADAYAKLNDTDAQIEGWVELVNEFPKERELRDRLLYVLLQCESEDAALHALDELNWDPRNEDLEGMVKDMFNELK